MDSLVGKDPKSPNGTTSTRRGKGSSRLIDCNVCLRGYCCCARDMYGGEPKINASSRLLAMSLDLAVMTRNLLLNTDMGIIMEPP